MPRKLRLSARKRHSSFTKASAIDSEVDKLCTTGTQTDAVRFSSVDVSTVGVQTDDCTAEENAQAPENLMTPIANSLFLSVPLRYFFELKVQSTVHLSQILNSMKCIEIVLPYEAESRMVKLVRVSDKCTISLEIASNMQWSVSVLTPN